MEYYQRNLPHWLPDGEAVFLTWRLYGSLPAEFVHGPRCQTRKTVGEQFRMAEKRLDRSQFGPDWLRMPEIAEPVVRTLWRGDSKLQHYVLIAYSVMPNHVHVLLTPRIELRRLTNGVKGVTARLANRILNRAGEPFWQDESFDHWVRDGAEFVRIKAYIERNPVKAGLVRTPQDWPWSSASRLARELGR